MCFLFMLQKLPQGRLVGRGGYDWEQLDGGPDPPVGKGNFGGKRRPF